MVTVPPGTVHSRTSERITTVSGKTRPARGHPTWQSTAARELMGFLSYRLPRQEFADLLASGWKEIGARMETAAREHRYTGVVPALRPSEAGMLMCCAAGAIADLEAGG
ncbi:hypothetical protein, partial [Streptomyces sp. TBY4]|uniref:hypothetical protein n=1 Tax=Streptomyces sp. TBY4 TaxID=2962030 RepID=UPI0020B736C5